MSFTWAKLAWSRRLRGLSGRRNVRQALPGFPSLGPCRHISLDVSSSHMELTHMPVVGQLLQTVDWRGRSD